MYTLGLKNLYIKKEKTFIDPTVVWKFALNHRYKHTHTHTLGKKIFPPVSRATMSRPSCRCMTTCAIKLEQKQKSVLNSP